MIHPSHTPQLRAEAVCRIGQLLAFGTTAARFRETADRTVMKPKRQKPPPPDPGAMLAEIQRLFEEDPASCIATVKAAEKAFAARKAGMTPAKVRESRARLRELRREMSWKAACIMLARTTAEMDRHNRGNFGCPDSRLFIRKALVTFRSAEKLLRHLPKGRRLWAFAIVEFTRNVCRGALRAIQSGRPFDRKTDVPLDGIFPRRSRRERPTP